MPRTDRQTVFPSRVLRPVFLADVAKFSIYRLQAGGSPPTRSQRETMEINSERAQLPGPGKGPPHN